MSIVSVLCRPSDRSLNRSLNRNADGTAGGIERRYVTLRSIGMSLFTKKEEPAQENVESKAAQPTSGKGRSNPEAQGCPGAESPSAGPQGSQRQP